MGLFGLVLLVLAVLLVVGAEWPRLAPHLRSDRRRPKRRGRGKARLTVIQGHGDSDDFAASVQRDLENLPVVEEPDRRR